MFKKKEELVNQSNLIKLYMAKYRHEMNEKEKEAVVNLVLSCEEEEEEVRKKWPKSRVCIVSNIIEHFRTFSNIM